MSGVGPAPGWWLASDGRWYPPELTPGYAIDSPMAEPTSVPPVPTQYFRSRVVLASGVVIAVIGIGLLLLGSRIATGHQFRGQLPASLTVALVGLFLLITGGSRMAARLEINSESLRWTWAFGRHHLRTSDVTDAALIEKGQPAHGPLGTGSGTAAVGGGLIGFIIWFVFDLTRSVLATGPTTGPRVLTVYPRHGSAVQIRTIGTWGTAASNTQAAAALNAVRAAIEASPRRPGPRS